MQVLVDDEYPHVFRRDALAQMAQWFFKSDLRKKPTAADAWSPYSAAQSKIIEQAFQAGKTSVKLDSKYFLMLLLLV